MITLSTIKDARKDLGLTQKDMAKKLGVTFQYYNMLENNKKQPSVSIAKEIGAILGIEWTIFFK
ncbi:helix-turn-helix transcriptional regulator [Mammaliicoccus fleurettii]|uniref:helix-turn-helix transcriptional regulator n=1 Tax=Mammaliicoccus fleurettii TaxID=150056 RepID=UPI001AACE62E|nr:helix-turn-helix transcriptional regulator [Mammaliicoccus fleurettii]MBO3062773.1 helix-turn-helix transcriptional regulator [Mammaliicoccus fleurettii]